MTATVQPKISCQTRARQLPMRHLLMQRLMRYTPPSTPCYRLHLHICVVVPLPEDTIPMLSAVPLPTTATGTYQDQQDACNSDSELSTAKTKALQLPMRYLSLLTLQFLRPHHHPLRFHQLCCRCDLRGAVLLTPGDTKPRPSAESDALLSPQPAQQDVVRTPGPGPGGAILYCPGR